MNLSMVVSGYPPDFDGIGDYTCLLAQALSRMSEVDSPVLVYTRKGEVRKLAGVDAIPFFDASKQHSFRSLLPLVGADAPDWLVLQYNPFGWGRRGFCPAVPKTLLAIRKLPRAPRIGVMFHELFTEDAGWKNRAMQIWQRVFAERVARYADLRLTSCQAYADWLENKRYPASCLPVGSNLPAGTAQRSNNPTGLIFGSFGSPHASRRMELVARAVAAVRADGIEASFLFVGSGGERARQDFERLGVPFRATGAVDPQKAADQIAGVDVFLAPFSDGLSGRRASAIAALKAGVPLLSSAGRRTDPFLRKVHGSALLLADTDEEFVRQATDLARDVRLREEIGGVGREFYNENLDWTVISSRLVTLMQAHECESNK
jgi:glycosyltransferase involved in cell wall biosynthesis